MSVGVAVLVVAIFVLNGLAVGAFGRFTDTLTGLMAILGGSFVGACVGTGIVLLVGAPLAATLINFTIQVVVVTGIALLMNIDRLVVLFERD